MSARKYLTIEDLCRIFGECRAEMAGQPTDQAKPLSPGYVRQLVSWSRGTRTTPGRYADTPMPLPDEDVRPLIWSPQGREGMTGLARRLRHWYIHERPGQGAGGGRKPADGVMSKAARQRVTQGSGRKR